MRKARFWPVREQSEQILSMAVRARGSAQQQGGGGGVADWERESAGTDFLKGHRIA